MLFPSLTATYAALLALLYTALSGWVSAARATLRVNHGDGGHARLNRRIRAHANFAEYVPLILLLIAFLEASGESPALVRTLLLVLLAARIAHPFGMTAPENSLRQYTLRGLPIIVTWLLLIITAILLLVRAA